VNIQPQLISGAACCPAIPAPPSSRVDSSLVRALDGATSHVDFLVPEMHCAACLSGIEGALGRLPGVVQARANLTSHRVGVTFTTEAGEPDDMLAAIEKLGYTARPFDAVALDGSGRDKVEAELLRSLAVAGFAASNVMLLSVSVWSGADLATRDLFHWISALIALPAIVYAGRPFFRSAFRAVRARQWNMDVPIAIGVSLAAAMSLYETATHGAHAYFDAAVSLLFFLLAGRFLDYRMRAVARSAASKLMALSARSVMRVEDDGTIVHVPTGEVVPGDRVLVATGERVAIDGVIESGASDIDRSMLTGEAETEAVRPGSRVFAGTLNLTGPLTIRATARQRDTLLAEIGRLMEAAERGGSRYVRLADRASRLYAPFVHLLALLTAIGWLVVGAGWHMALTTAVAVLIITCPCALGLAVPAVQVVASGALLRRGIMLKDGVALERLATVDTVVFDKTGTLTKGEPRLVDVPEIDQRAWSIALALGSASRHPLARALAAAAESRGATSVPLDAVGEHPGDGMAGSIEGVPVRLGRGAWVGAPGEGGRGAEIWLRIGDQGARRFVFEDTLRTDARATVASLQEMGLDVKLLSGDRTEAVADLARRVGIADWRAEERPAGKAAFLSGLAKEGKRVLMVGDGINDAPALATAFVSMSPASAADISQTAAAILFTGARLDPVLLAYRMARGARRLILQNFAIAIGYNIVAVPVAMLGHATPLIAAIAMSLSSIVVTANALRLAFVARQQAPEPSLPIVHARESIA
jgi:Cu2+-exporting ATPase